MLFSSLNKKKSKALYWPTLCCIINIWKRGNPFELFPIKMSVLCIFMHCILWLSVQTLFDNSFSACLNWMNASDPFLSWMCRCGCQGEQASISMCTHTPGVYCCCFYGLYNTFLISFIFLQQAHPDSHWPLKGWEETRTNACKFLSIYHSRRQRPCLLKLT